MRWWRKRIQTAVSMLYSLHWREFEQAEAIPSMCVCRFVNMNNRAVAMQTSSVLHPVVAANMYDLAVYEVK
jgi:hypothetical protein